METAASRYAVGSRPLGTGRRIRNWAGSVLGGVLSDGAHAPVPPQRTWLVTDRVTGETVAIPERWEEIEDLGARLRADLAVLDASTFEAKWLSPV